VYPAGDPHIARAKATVAAFGPIWQYAHDMGMRVYMSSDMLALSPASYNEVVGGLDDPHLIVSTKYCLGDFYSYLPLNDTLMTGSQRRIVEFQARREFEGLGAFPNDLGPLEQIALRTFLAANPHIEGVWNWSQIGGRLRAGPRTLYLRAAFWQIFELNT
jgi:hypothetical protein